MPDKETSAIAAQLAALVADLEQRTVSVDTGMAELVDSALRHVPGGQYAGITLAHSDTGIDTVGATHHYPVVLDKIQQRYQEGPCVAAAWNHHTMRIDDMSTEQRWPTYCRDAAEQTPIRSILSFELFTNTSGMAALNFFAEQPHAFGEEAEELGAIFAAHVALAWTMLRRDEQFRGALASRDVIGQAKGIIMERFHVDSVQAFELLKHLSQDTNIKLVDMAQRLIAADHPSQDI